MRLLSPVALYFLITSCAAPSSSDPARFEAVRVNDALVVRVDRRTGQLLQCSYFARDAGHITCVEILPGLTGDVSGGPTTANPFASLIPKKSGDDPATNPFADLIPKKKP